MKQLVDCDTCGYPLLPEERERLVEIDGKMCKPINRQPVAWMDSEGDVYPMPENPKWCPPHVLLYAALPQRQPIDDKTLWEMWVESPSDVLRFARAIERAHGIGDKK